MESKLSFKKIESLEAKISNLCQDIAYTRCNIRGLQHDISDLERKLDADLNEDPYKDNENVYSARELEHAEYIEEIELFLQSNVKIFKHGNVRLSTKIDVKLDNQTVVFLINKKTTYESLSKQVGSYWGIHPSTIFFSDEPPTSSFPPVHLREGNVLRQSYMWKKCRLSYSNAVLYVILRGYENISFQNQNFLLDIDKELPIEPTFIQSEVPCEEEKQSEMVFKRVRKNFLINMFQSVMLMGFTLYWLTISMHEQDIFNTSWMNHFIQYKLFGYPSPMEQSIYRKFPDISYYGICNSWDIWKYLLNKKHSIVDYGGINEFSSIYEGIQLHQVRSNLYWCEIEAYPQVVCLRRHSLDPNFEDYSSKKEGFTYDNSDKELFLQGQIDWYSLHGFKVSLPLRNLSRWETKIASLESEEWIDVQTRGVFISFNIVNPSLGVLTTLINLIEIGRNGNYVPGYKLASISYSNLNTKFLYSHLFILVWALVLAGFYFRNLLKSKNEIVFVEIRKYDRLKNSLPENSFEKEMSKVLKQWLQHEQAPWYRRIRKPRWGEFVIMSTVAFALFLEISFTFWYFGKISQTITEEMEHTQLYDITGMHAKFVDLKFLVVLALIGLLCKSLIYYFRMLSEFYFSLYKYIKDVIQAIFLIYVCIFVLAVVFYYTIGSFIYRLTTYYDSVFFVSALAVGNLRIEVRSFHLIFPTEILLLVIVYRFTVYLFMLIFTSKFFTTLSNYRIENEENK